MKLRNVVSHLSNPMAILLFSYETAKKPFDEVSFPIRLQIIAVRGGKVRSWQHIDPPWRDNGLCAMFLNEVTNAGCIVSFVCHNLLDFFPRPRLANLFKAFAVLPLGWKKHAVDNTIVGNSHMHGASQSFATSTHSLRALVFLKRRLHVGAAVRSTRPQRQYPCILFAYFAADRAGSRKTHSRSNV